MKFSTLSVGILALLTPLTAAWSKEGEPRYHPLDTPKWPHVPVIGLIATRWETTVA